MPNTSYLMAKQVQDGLGLPKGTFTWPWPNKPVSARPSNSRRPSNGQRKATNGRSRGGGMKKKAGLAKMAGFF